MKRIIISTVLLAIGAAASAASFDCAKASTTIEKTICSDERLSELDAQLGQSYKKSFSDQEKAEAVKTAQRIWIAVVRNKCQDTTCLKRAYAERIKDLDGPAPLVIAQPVEHRTEVISVDAPASSHRATKAKLPSSPPASQLVSDAGVSVAEKSRADEGIEKIALLKPPPAGAPFLSKALIEATGTDQKLLELALKRVKNYEYAQAMPLLRYLTLRGDAEAPRVLGDIHGMVYPGVTSAYITFDIPGARQLYQLAEKRGNLSAMVGEADLIRKWDRFKNELLKAVMLYSVPASKGDKQAIAGLAVIAVMTPTSAESMQANMELKKLGISTDRIQQLAAIENARGNHTNSVFIDPNTGGKIQDPYCQIHASAVEKSRRSGDLAGARILAAQTPANCK